MHQNEYRISKNVTPGSPLWGWTQSTGGAKKQTWPGAQFFHGTALTIGNLNRFARKRQESSIEDEKYGGGTRQYIKR